MEEINQTVVGVVRGPCTFWLDGKQVFPVEGKVRCSRVGLPETFVSEETDPETGKPVWTGYLDKRGPARGRAFVDAAKFAALTAHADRRKGGELLVPVATEGSTVVETTTVKIAHTYKVWAIGLVDGQPAIAWAEARFVPPRTTVADSIRARFGAVKDTTAFPEVIPVKGCGFGFGCGVSRI